MAHALMDDPAGWSARLELEFTRRNGLTVASGNRHQGPLRLQRPLYPETGVCHAVILHPPGGVVGGDRLEIRTDVQAGAAALITTPGAAKYYRSNGATAVQENILEVARRGRLEWLPQENIVFPGADAATVTRVDLAGDAGFIGWEIVCFGLPACGQPFLKGRLKTCFEIRRDGRPLFKDRLRVGGGEVSRPTGLRGCSVSATLLASGCSPAMLVPLRAMAQGLPHAMTGITLMDDLLVARYLGHDSSAAKTLLSEIWKWLRPALFGRPACPPRIWET